MASRNIDNAFTARSRTGASSEPTYAGALSFMRRRYSKDVKGADAVVWGIPFDAAVTNRPGARFGPQAIRRASAIMDNDPQYPFHRDLFDKLAVVDYGDCLLDTGNHNKTPATIEREASKILKSGAFLLTLGGDHTLSYPILRAMAEKYGPVGLIHVDAHADINEHMFGESIAHGTPFRRAVEAGVLDTKRCIQIGLRGTGYAADDFDWSREQGFRVVQAEECWHKSLTPLMEEVRAQMGDGPVYLTYDIDSLDPSIAPGTGTPEIGGLNTIQALEIIRGCWGLNLVGCDLVEVSPPYDPAGNTAITAANLLFEMLCVLPGVKRR